jgi:glutamate carboxypeptidase
MNNAQLTTFLDQKLLPTLDLLKQMIAINSFTANKDGVNELSRFTASAFAKLGFTAEFVPSTNPDFGDHLVMTRKGKSRRTIGLISHLDTVFPPEEEKRNNFSWRISGDKIYGPGTMDIKGGTAMMHLVLSAMREIYPQDFEETNWVLLLNSSEEALSYDFGKLCLNCLPPDTLAALVFEAGVREGNIFEMVTARKGRATFRVTAEGRGAHAGGDHERGANAIIQLAHTAQRIAALTDYSKELTFNVGNMSGGTVANRVPHHAVAELEMRAFSPEIFNAGVEALNKLSNDIVVRAAADHAPCRVTIEKLSETPPWPRNEMTESLLRVWQETGKSLGLKVIREERGGLSDGNHICHKIPTLDGLGPRGDNAHCSEQSADGSKEQEFVEVSSFVPKAALNIEAIKKLLDAGR